MKHIFLVIKHLAMSEKTDKVSMKGEEIVQRASYRKHRQRLADIKHNLTGKDFFLDSHPRPSDRKGMLRNQLKQQQIQHENQLLQNKIINIKSRSQQDVDPPFISKTQQVRTNQIRYEEEEGKIDIRSDLSDGQPVRCIVPTKIRANSFHQTSKLSNKPELKSYFTSKPQKIYQLKPKPQSFHRSHKSERSQPRVLPEELLFKLPQRNEMRSVLHHKTVLLSSSISCLYELSLIGERLLIAAHIIGKERYCITELIPLKKSKQLLKDYENDFDSLFEKITLEESKGKYYALKINVDKSEGEQKDLQSQQEKTKVKIKLQNEFIRRNYYETLKKEDDASQGTKTKPTIPNQKLQELFERLAAPKRYLLKDHVYTPPLPQQISKPKTHSKTSIQVEKRNMVERQKEYGTDKRIQKDHFEEQTPKSQAQFKIQKTESLTIEEPLKQQDKNVKKVKPEILNSQIIAQKGKEPEKSEQQEVDYLQGDNYEEQFENPSSLNQSHPPKDPLQSSSKVEIKVGKEAENKKEIVENEDENQQQYEDAFEVSSPKIAENQKDIPIKNNSSVAVSHPEQKVEEEYAQDQFQT